jgi:hypothetical protein
MDLDEEVQKELNKTSTKKLRFFEAFGSLVICAAIILVVISGGVLWREAREWNPLGDYPIQIVTTEEVIIEPVQNSGRNSQIGLPVIYLDQTANSTGIKCVKPEEGQVTIRGDLSWVSDEPPGKFIKIIENVSSTRGPGCINYEFKNEVPPQVKAEIKKLTAAGINQSTWHLTGHEVPIRDDGTEGEGRTWQTTSFVVLHSEAP